MGCCCYSPKNKEASETTYLLSQSKLSKHQPSNTDDILANIVTLMSTNEESKEDSQLASLPLVPMDSITTSDRRDSTNSVQYIPSLSDTHIHQQIHPSLFINHWFRDKIHTIPKTVIHLITNYVIKQHITAIAYIDTHRTSEAFMKIQTQFVLDGIYTKDDKDLMLKQMHFLADDFLSGYNTAFMTFGNKKISKQVMYGSFVRQKGLLYLCLEHIFEHLMNCCLFIQIYGIYVNALGKEEYIDLLGSDKKGRMKDVFENKMLINMNGFKHLMTQCKYRLKWFEARYKKDIIIVFELSLQRIMNEYGVTDRLMDIMHATKGVNHMMNDMELKVSKMCIVDIGNVNPIQLVRNTPNTKLFRTLSNKIRKQHNSLLNMADVIEYIGTNAQTVVDSGVVDSMSAKSLLTLKLRECFGGNCRTIVCGTCSNNESEKANTETTFEIAQTAMNIQNDSCIHMFVSAMEI
eukprot:527889_1